MPLSGASEKARCQIFREKFRSPASRKTLQSLAVAANIPCLTLFAIFLLRPIIVREPDLLKYVAEVCNEKFVWRCIDSILFEDFGNAWRRFCEVYCRNWQCCFCWATLKPGNRNPESETRTRNRNPESGSRKPQITENKCFKLFFCENCFA